MPSTDKANLEIRHLLPYRLKSKNCYLIKLDTVLLQTNEQNKREKETANWVLFFFLNFEIIFRFFEIIWYKTTSIISQPSIDIWASNLDFFYQSQFGLLLWRKKQQKGKWLFAISVQRHINNVLFSYIVYHHILIDMVFC